MPSKQKEKKQMKAALGKALAKSANTKRTDQPSEMIDRRTAAAAPVFTAEDLGITIGKKAPTNTGMKTVLGKEAAMDVDRRIADAARPIGVAPSDECAIEENLSFETIDLSLAPRLMPRRPEWSFEQSSGRLHHREVRAFEKWMADARALIVERGGYPPAFEQNLQVWRQIWRLLERCDVAVVVVDARHPLLHFPPALYHHVHRTLAKPLVVVLNKIDAVDPQTCAKWAQCLKAGMPGIDEVIGYSKEGVFADKYAPLQIGQEALIKACHKAHDAHAEVRKAAEAKAVEEEKRKEEERAAKLAARKAAAAQRMAERQAAAEKGELADAADLDDVFEPADSWEGARSGLVFKLGELGLGYYTDRPPVVAKRAKKKAEEADKKAAEKPETGRGAKTKIQLKAGQILLKITSLRGELLEFAMSKEHTVNEIKVKIEYKDGTPSDHKYALFFNSKMLNDSLTLEDCGMKGQVAELVMDYLQEDKAKVLNARIGVDDDVEDDDEDAKDKDVFKAADGRVMLGLVGHPNVGKSSLVNHMFGGKVVSVKATPGHTKILQTLQLDEETCLCDGPGVVFPRLEVPREAQTVGMLIPMAQVREPFSALRWVMEHAVTPLDQMLKLKPLTLQQVEELQANGTDALQFNNDLVQDAVDNDRPLPWSPMTLCAQYAIQRGFTSRGRPDCIKAGKAILDRVFDGKIPYAVPAPEIPKPVAHPEERKCVEESDSEEEDDYFSEEEPDQGEQKLFERGWSGHAPPSKATARRAKRKEKIKKLAGGLDGGMSD